MTDNDLRMAALAEHFQNERQFTLHLKRAMAKMSTASEVGHACILTVNEVRAFDFAVRHASQVFQQLKEE